MLLQYQGRQQCLLRQRRRGLEITAAATTAATTATAATTKRQGWLVRAVGIAATNTREFQTAVQQ